MTKKFTALLLAVFMIAGVLAGCGQQAAAPSTGSNTAQTTAEPTAPEASAETTEPQQTESAAEPSTEAEPATTGGKTLVVYYSAQGHTGEFAKVIAEELGADTLELIPENDYTSADLNYNDRSSRVVAEYEDESLRDVKLVQNTVEGWDEYDTVYIGYPIWWGIAAWPVNDFVANNDFTGKTVIPFCSAYSSGIGRSGELLAQLAGTGDWQDGARFQQNEDVENARAWAASMK